MRVVRSSLALTLMGFALAACDGLTIETATRTAADTGAVEDTGGSDTDAGEDTALDTGAEDTAVDTATDTAADTAVDTAPDTAADTAPDTTVSSANRCGGDAPLTYRGAAAGPGDSCGLCGDGQLFCSGTNDLTCAGASQPNDCGGCGLLTGDVGTSCGLCDDGVWACGGGSSECVGDRPPNGCGGCTALALEPGTECPLVGGDAGVVVCAGRELSRCASVGTNGCGGTAALTLPAGITDVEPRPGVVYEAGCRRGVLLCDGATLVAIDLEGGNACGGCEPLLGEPGASCDACGGVWLCDVEGGLRCNGGGRNACGGCELLAAEPGSACNDGGTAGAIICIGAEETGCVPAGATNDCGGLGSLSDDVLGTACGACGDGVVACDPTDPLRRRTACTGASAQNACGGCGILDATVGSACGTCGTGDYACDGTSLVCSNDDGGAAANVCGGCATLAANPGDPCGRCGAWACDTAVPGRLACDEPVGGCASVAVCGNGAVETGEGCDEGNRVTEPCAYAELSCTVCNAICQSVAGATSYCGDGLLDAAEVCDEGPSNGAGSCSVACTCATGYHLEGGVCTSDTRACSLSNATAATETWTGSVYGACVATACVSDFALCASNCVAIGNPLGSACTCDAECGSGNCATGPFGTENDRCAPEGMNYIPAGTFVMGSPLSELGRDVDVNETQHTVTLSRSFFMGQTEVTQGQWKALSGGANPSCFQATTGTGCITSNTNDSGPAENLEWYTALLFANARSAAEGLTSCYALPGCAAAANGWQDGIIGSGCTTGATFAGLTCTGYRLPTESEWEYAARGGTTTATYLGNLNGSVSNCSTAQTNLDGIAWWCINAELRTQSVGGKSANSFGLFDMLGNVYEYTSDWYDGTYPGTVTDPTGPTTGAGVVTRGGSWNVFARQARAAHRDATPPYVRYNYLGFRLARTILRSEDCATGYHVEGGVCASNTRTCSPLPANTTVGTQTWTGSAYASCTATACAATYHVESGVCTSDTRSCAIANGTGTEAWNGTSYGTCTLTTCDSGYHVNGNSCDADASTCTAQNCDAGNCVPVWLPNGTSCDANSTDCTISICQDGACVAENEADCTSCGNTGTGICGNGTCFGPNESSPTSFAAGSALAPLTSSSPAWAIDTSQGYTGGSSLKSGTIPDSGRSTVTLVTTTMAGQALSFWYKVSSEATYDLLRFKVDGATRGEWSGTVAWTQFTTTLTAGTHTLVWEYSKDGNSAAGSDAAWIDDLDIGIPNLCLDECSLSVESGAGCIACAPPADDCTACNGGTEVCVSGICGGLGTTSVIERFESATWPAAFTSTTRWTSSDAVPSPGAGEGLRSAQSNSIGDSSSTAFRRTFTVGAGATLAFKYRVSSEATYDFLKVTVDGTEVLSASGTVAWTDFSRAMTAGSHSVVWTYIKDASGTAGSDAAWVDLITVTDATSCAGDSCGNAGYDGGTCVTCDPTSCF